VYRQYQTVMTVSRAATTSRPATVMPTMRPVLSELVVESDWVTEVSVVEITLPDGDVGPGTTSGFEVVVSPTVVDGAASDNVPVDADVVVFAVCAVVAVTWNVDDVPAVAGVSDVVVSATEDVVVESEVVVVASDPSAAAGEAVAWSSQRGPTTARPMTIARANRLLLDTQYSRGR
jgi:hypothetical protein